ncbi:Hypothetical predicted protein [Pelobates cultripes]|uniref:Uncharacterized protein n=1 Tax=Pelobates cultripes TaxID=61616 RepID=A0AAD1S5J6_PELCU|nr:Hypothetical predicted protein [Pelobates cultripes]
MEKSTNHNISQLQYSVIRLLPLPLSLLLASQLAAALLRSRAAAHSRHSPQPRTPFPMSPRLPTSRLSLSPTHSRLPSQFFSRLFTNGDIAAAIFRCLSVPPTDLALFSRHIGVSSD